MAVRIPTYEDRLTPSGLVTPQARGVEISGAIGQGMQNLGNAGTELAVSEMKVQRYQDEQAKMEAEKAAREAKIAAEKLQQKENEEAINRVGPDLANASAQWPNRVDELAQNSVSGGMIKGEDGQFKTITETLQSEFAKYREQYLSQVVNDHARTYASRHLDSVWAQTFNRSLATEAKLKVEDKSDNIDKTVSTLASVAASGTTDPTELVTNAYSLIANSGLDQHTRNIKAIAAQKSIVEAAVMGNIERNPEATRAALVQRYGIDPDVPAPPAAAGAPGAPAGPVDFQTLWNAQTNQESGRKQFKPDGSVVTSSKGALGLAQIMPGTGPEAAKLAGLPWDENRLKNDPVYNEKLGQAYMQKQLETFGGDPAKALAAYNMGPGSEKGRNGVIGLINKYGDQWLAHAPKETQDYVSTIMGKVGGRPAAASASAAPLPGQEAKAVDDVAQHLGVDPRDLMSVIGHISGFAPNSRDGEDVGLLHFSPEDQKKYGVTDKQSFTEQMQAVEKYLKDKGVQPGAGVKSMMERTLLLKNSAMDQISYGMSSKEFDALPEDQKAAFRAQYDAKSEEQKQLDVSQYSDKSIQDLRANPKATSDYFFTQYSRPAAPAKVAVPAAPVSGPLANLVGQVDADRLSAFISHASSEVSRRQTVARSQLLTTEGDHTTAFLNGDQVPRPLTEADYVKAFGPVEGAQRYSTYAKIGQMGVDITALKMQSPQQMEATLARYKPDPSVPGYELANKRYDAMVAAVNKVNADRIADPIAFAQQNKLMAPTPIDWNKPDQVTALLSTRTGLAQEMSQRYSTPFQLLSKQEAANLAAGFNNMGAAQKLAYLGTIVKAVPNPDAQRSIFAQIAPDSPLTALSGRLVTMSSPNVVGSNRWFSSTTEYSPQQVATMVLRGEAILNPNKAAKGEDGKPSNLVMPKETDLRTQFDSMVGKAFGNANQSAQLAFQGVKAYYAAKSEQASDYSGNIDSSRMREAIEAVTGGATDVNGRGQVLRPWGMSESTFIDQAKTAFDAKAKEIGLTGPTANFGIYGLENFGDGYHVRVGTGYLHDSTGNDVVLQIGDARPAMSPRSVQGVVGKEARPITAPAKTK